MNRILVSAERSVSPPEAAQELMNRTASPWAFQSFALGWLRLDVLARLLLVIVLGVTPVLMTMRLDRQVESSESLLRQHRDLGAQMLQNPKAFAELSKVEEVTVQYRNELELHRRLEVVALALLGVLAAFVAVGQYHRYVAVKHLKVALDFFRTDEGIAWLKENRDRIGRPPG